MILQVYVQPGAKKTEITGVHGGRLKIRVHAQPEDGKANVELVLFLAEFFNLSRTQVEIVRGQTSRKKDVLLSGISSEKVNQRLLE